MVESTYPANRFGAYSGRGTHPEGMLPVSIRGEPGRYLADAELVVAVNTALAVEQPLLVTGEPGTGKSALAWSIASELGLGEPLLFYTRSDSHARDLLYIYDYLPRYLDAQLQDRRAAEPQRYVRFVAIGAAIVSQSRRVVLIDEIDKAPRDFSNDLLDLLDHMAFNIPETGINYASTYRPIVVITSNSERQLSDPFLRRCIFHHIQFPSRDHLHQILRERLNYNQIAEHLLKNALDKFLQLRDLRHLDKRPATSELLTWVSALLAAGIDAKQVAQSPLSRLPLIGALVKTKSDQDVLSSLADS